MNAAIIYWSGTGNTEKVALAIREALQAGGVDVSFRRAEEAQGINFYDYDLICVGFPSYQWHPPKPMDEFLIGKFGEHRRQGRIKIGAPKVAETRRAGLKDGCGLAPSGMGWPERPRKGPKRPETRLLKNLQNFTN
jgi:hypothetical protein